MKTLNKKAQAGNLQAFILSIVGVAVVLAVGLIVLAELADTQANTGAAGCNATVKTACGTEYNITQNSLDGLDATAEKMPTVGRIVVAAIIITVILAAFGGFVMMRQ